MVKISKKIALKAINKLPIPKEQKEEIKEGVLKELDNIKNMSAKELQAYLKAGEKSWEKNGNLRSN